MSKTKILRSLLLLYEFSSLVSKINVKTGWAKGLALKMLVDAHVPYWCVWIQHAASFPILPSWEAAVTASMVRSWPYMWNFQLLSLTWSSPSQCTQLESDQEIVYLSLNTAGKQKERGKKDKANIDQMPWNFPPKTGIIIKE